MRLSLGMKTHKIIIGLSLCFIIKASICAGKSFVLWDQSNDLPIHMASVYTTSGGSVKSTFSDEHGRVNVNFVFDSLIVSHINFRKITLTCLPDTLYMKQSIPQLPELVVEPDDEPSWVRPMLMNFIKTYSDKYRHHMILEYQYETQNIGDSTLYKFSSRGLLKKTNICEISPIESIITFRDRTAGCDYSNLKNTLYHDFVTDLNQKFVKEHYFYVNDDADDSADSVVRIYFKSKKGLPDNGYICMDTTRNIIIRAKRSTGLKFNVINRTKALVRATFSGIYGQRYKDWQITIESEYKPHNGNLYLSRCLYSNFIQEEYDSRMRKGESTYNMSSTYSAAPYNGDMGNANFMELPKPFAMKIIASRKESRQEERLQTVNKKYVFY